MKAEDDKIYKEGDSSVDALTRYIPIYEKTGQFRCVGLTLSHPDIEFLAMDDCTSKHSYLCGKVESCTIDEETYLRIHQIIT